ncbi:putative inorganic carbon (hco3(-)) transporter [Methylomarinovum caldicuralii]|uniref:Inorganic carbon (Hco3(-)) transporter n=1 Tax=Methylomarinovum caldicuralii TaxID=438856 RepID=A0AAU9CGN2_9GAMM|nr:putative O-glycosylation ligase, exosortase A system-associated [Methylomarinovum caldicuralii]BCX82145.1 putative inorganic carbon (hco3(-)) transporter [Methylomarinovum caldicuralii]
MGIPLRDVFVTVVVFYSLPFILRRPEIGILMWAWLGYMNPHKLSWQFAHDFPFAQIVALTTMFSLLISREPKRIPWTRETILLIIFNIWMFITTLFAMYPELAWGQWNKVWKIQLMTFVSMMIMTNRWRIQTWVWVIALSLGFYGFKGGVFTVLTGGAYAVYGPEGTFIGGNNEIGLALIMTVPLLRYCQLTTDHFWAKRLLLIGMILCVIAIVGTQSRGAFLGVAVMLMFLLRNSRHKWTLLIVMGLALPVIYTFMPESWHERMSTIKTYQQDGSAMGRINAWWMAFNLAKDRILGGGFECFRAPTFAMYAPDPRDVHDAHSIYFEVLGEQGFIGLALFLAIGYSAWRSCKWIMRQTKNWEDLRWVHDLGAMLQVSLVGYAVSGAFLGMAYFDLYYNLIALIVLAKEIAGKALKEQEAATEKKPPAALSFVVRPVRSGAARTTGPTSSGSRS